MLIFFASCQLACENATFTFQFANPLLACNESGPQVYDSRDACVEYCKQSCYEIPGVVRATERSTAQVTTIEYDAFCGVLSIQDLSMACSGVLISLVSLLILLLYFISCCPARMQCCCHMSTRRYCVACCRKRCCCFKQAPRCNWAAGERVPRPENKLAKENKRRQ